MVQFDLIDFKEIIDAWSRARSLKRIGTEYPDKAPWLNEVLTNKEANTLLLSEEEIDEIDNALLLLRKIDLPRYRLFIDSHLEGLSCKDLAIKKGKGKTNIVESIRLAEMFVMALFVHRFMDKFIPKSRQAND